MYGSPSYSSRFEGGASPSPLQSAIAFLRRGLRPDGTYEGVDEWEFFEHQWRLLHQWAKSAGLIVPPDVVPARLGGAEHDVSHFPASGRWLKFTKPSRAGVIVELQDGCVQMLPASPLQYLRRWRFANQLFADDVELVGVSETNTHLRIVISQRDVHGEAPSWDEIDFAMTQRFRLRRVNTDASVGGYEARAYAGDRVAVFDVRPANCVRKDNGLIVPFDVIPRALNRQDAAFLRNLCL